MPVNDARRRNHCLLFDSTHSLHKTWRSQPLTLSISSTNDSLSSVNPPRCRYHAAKQSSHGQLQPISLRGLLFGVIITISTVKFSLYVLVPRDYDDNETVRSLLIKVALRDLLLVPLSSSCPKYCTCTVTFDLGRCR